MLKFIFIPFLLISLWSCSQNIEQESLVKEKNKSSKDLDSFQTAYFAAGCFWCVEAVFESIEGVEEVVSGYSGGSEKNPTYEQVSAGRTGHAESVKIFYDSSIVSYDSLVAAFFSSHDPTTLNRQGPDSGRQYRSAIFYQTDYEKNIAENYIEFLLNKKVFSKITTEVTPFLGFYEAESYHQDFEANNPDNSYVQRVSLPRLNSFKRKMPYILKKKS